jgi:hypothetical protein
VLGEKARRERRGLTGWAGPRWSGSAADEICWQAGGEGVGVVGTIGEELPSS